MELISIKTAKLARKKGLNPELDLAGNVLGYSLRKDVLYPSYYHVHMCYPPEKVWLYAPYQAELQRWLRENHSIDIYIDRSFSMEHSYHYVIVKDEDHIQQAVKKDRSYEEALEKALHKALTLIKDL